MCDLSNQTIFEWTAIILRVIIIFCPSRTWCLLAVTGQMFFPTI